MKKIIFAALSVLLMFSFVGCGEHLVDFKVIDLSNGAVPGDFSIPANWDNTTPFTTVDKDKNTYTFEFTLKEDAGSEIGFKILTESGNWDCAGYTEFNVTVDGPAVDANFIDNCGPAKNAFVKGCESGKTYKMTVVCNEDSSATVKVVSMADPVYPTPFWLDGYYARGLGGNWNAEANTLLCNGDFDVTTGIIIYTKDFTATAADAGFGIATSDWGSKYVEGTFTIGTDTDYVATKLAGASDNMIKGMKVGNPYRLYVKVTPEKEVSFKVEEICQVNLTFKITGLTEGDAAWINGTVWNGWACGWPLAAWNTPIGNGLELSDAPVADADGVAVFGAKWNVSKIAKPGDVLNHEVKFLASDDDWASTKYDNANIKFSISVEGAASYEVTINAADNTASVTKL